jgi:hypothetical protein
MRWSIFPLPLRGIVLPSAAHFLHVAAPVLAVAAAWLVITQADGVLHRIFPHSEWEKSLGWLNIRAQRRADTALRLTAYAIYALLLCALYGIIWGAEGLQSLGNWSDPWVMGELALRVPVLFFCLGLWFLYLGCGLLPSLRRQRARREIKQLKRYRIEAEEAESEREMHSPSRVKSPLVKPRTDAPLGSLVPDKSRRRLL